MDGASYIMRSVLCDAVVYVWNLHLCGKMMEGYDDDDEEEEDDVLLISDTYRRERETSFLSIRL